MESLVLSTKSANQDLIPNQIAISASLLFQKCNFKPIILEFLINTRKVIGLIDPFPKRKVTLQETIHSSETPFHFPLRSIKVFHFVSSLELIATYRQDGA